MMVERIRIDAHPLLSMSTSSETIRVLVEQFEVSHLAGVNELRTRLDIFCALLLAVLVTTGCGRGGGDTVHLKGNVTLDGAPFPANAQASVTFQPATGNKGKATTASIVNGAYDSPNAPRGPVLAIMSISIPTGKMVKSERMGTDVPEINTVTLAQDQMGGIAFEVAGGKTAHDFDFKSRSN